MKRFLLFSGDDYYPRPAWRDFVGSFDTVQEALEHNARRDNGLDWYQVVDTQTQAIVSE